MKILLILFSCIVSYFFSFAQIDAENFVRGNLIIQLKPQASINSLQPSFIINQNQQVKVEVIKCLSSRMKIYLLSFDTSKANEAVMIGVLQTNSLISIIQLNHKVEQRALPNDTEFNQMWSLNNTGQSGVIDADIDAPEAWNITTGGLTFYNDSIVVADIDGGFDLNHQDINYWRNYNEVPGNGVDDDGNGYIDDHRGWNAYNSTGTISSNMHGTHTAGTIAAKGNNGIGITGIGWNTQLMPIAGSGGDEATVIEAYGYALDMRAAYNTSIGTGAFVVATNSSFGVNFGQPAAYPLWCAMYDSLGAYGILSAGATANLNINIDSQSDIPTACASNYLVTVTNTTSNDTRNSSAAFGLNTIDLGAPGTDILSTIPGNSYNTLTGTSMATPHVAGAIGLMYSLQCKNFMDAARSNPSQTALNIKNFFLQGVDTIPDLLNKTVSGGRLNLYKSLKLQRNFYGCFFSSVENMTKEFESIHVYPNPAMSLLTAQFISIKEKNIRVIILNSLGQEIISKTIHINPGMTEEKIDINFLSPGIYLFCLHDLVTGYSSTASFSKQ